MKKTMIKFISGVAALALALVSFQGVSASTSASPLQAASAYYVSPTGNDANLCTSAAPCKTFTRALNLAVSGDTVIALAGTYNQQVTISKSGITLEGRGAVIDTLTQNGIRVTPTASNIIVRGFTVVHTKSHAIFVEGANVLIEGNTVYHSILENGTLSNGVITCGNNAWGSGIKAERGSSYVTFRNNISRDNCGEGIASTMSHNVVIEGNTSYDNKNVNIYIDNSYFVKVSNNLSYCTQSGTRPIGIALGQESYSGWGAQLHDIEVSNNTIRDCSTGIMAFGSVGTLTNVLFKGNYIPTGQVFTGQAFALSLDNPKNLNVRIENNSYFREPWIRSKTNVTSVGNVVGMLPPVTQSGPSVTATQTQTPKPVSPTVTQTQTSKPVFPTVTQTQTPKPVSPTVTRTQTPKPASPTVTQTQTPKPVSPTVTQTQTPKPASPTSTQAVPVTPTASPTLLVPTMTVTSIPATLTATTVPITPASTETAMPENTVPVQPTGITYDDSDTAFVYSAGWSDVSKRKSYGGAYKETNENGASVTLIFSGTSFSVLYAGGPNFRSIDVYVDDILVGSINQKAEDRRYQLRWDYAGQLEPGSHVLKLVLVSDNKKAKGSLDAVIVR